MRKKIQVELQDDDIRVLTRALELAVEHAPGSNANPYRVMMYFMKEQYDKCVSFPIKYCLVNERDNRVSDWTEDRAHLDAYLAERPDWCSKYHVATLNPSILRAMDEAAYYQALEESCPKCHGDSVPGTLPDERHCLTCGLNFELHFNEFELAANAADDDLTEADLTAPEPMVECYDGGYAFMIPATEGSLDFEKAAEAAEHNPDLCQFCGSVCIDIDDKDEPTVVYCHDCGREYIEKENN
jgi:hypothetical protein